MLQLLFFATYLMSFPLPQDKLVSVTIYFLTNSNPTCLPHSITITQA